VDEEQYNALRDAAGLLMTGQAKIEKPADDERRANEV
jgi:hypothetical protein